MDIGEIFSNSIKYPISDYMKLLILGVIFVLIQLVAILAVFGFYNDTFSLIWAIVSFVLTILVMGYGLSVVRHSIELYDEIPEFDWANNLVDGIKYFVVAFVYFIIPTIITGIIAFATAYGPLSTIFTEDNIAQFAALNSTITSADVFAIVPEEVWGALITAVAITAVIAIILFIIFAIFENIAICRLAKYGSLGEAFSVGEIYGDIKQIGILKIIAFLIVAFIISSVIGIISGFVMAIPYVGIIISALVFSSFLILFNSRALGLLYSEV